MREDSQPNEIRLGRKGRPMVPTVRSTQPNAHPRGMGGYYYPHAPRATSTRQRHDIASAATSSAPSSSPKMHTQRWGPYPDAQRGRWQRSPATGFSPSSRRPCSDIPAPAASDPNSSRKAILSIELDLPVSCHKGAANRKTSCQRWVGEQIVQLEANLGLKVISHAFTPGYKVCFEYRADLDGKHGASVVNLPAGNSDAILHIPIHATASTHQQRSASGLTELGNRQPDPRRPDAAHKNASGASQNHCIGGANPVRCTILLSMHFY